MAEGYVFALPDPPDPCWFCDEPGVRYHEDPTARTTGCAQAMPTDPVTSEWLDAAERMLETADVGESLDVFLLRALVCEPALESSVLNVWHQAEGLDG